MENKMDELLYHSLRPMEEPAPELNRQILEWRSNKSMRKNGFRKSAVAAAVACAAAVSSITAVAAYHYLKPSQVAEEVSDNDSLAKAFESPDAVKINQTQRSDDYEVTLLGMVSGADMSICVPEDALPDQTFVVLAVAHIDGSAVSDEEQKCISPLIHGVDFQLANNATLETGLHTFRKDGVLYELIECDSLEKFAGRGVQLGVVDSFGQETQAFVMDEQTGVYRQQADYEGTNLLFDLPFDPSKADEQAAEQYLQSLREKMDSEDDEDTTVVEELEDSQMQTFNNNMKQYIDKDDEAGFLREYAELIPGTKQVLKMDKEGCVHYKGSGEKEGTLYAKELEVGKQTISSWSSGDNLESLEIDVFTKNEDGTVTYEEYRPVAQ